MTRSDEPLPLRPSSSGLETRRDYNNGVLCDGAGRRPPAAAHDHHDVVCVHPRPVAALDGVRIAAVNAPRSTLCALANGVEVLARDLKRVYAAGASRN
jgi:hypothetical protein